MARASFAAAIALSAALAAVSVVQAQPRGSSPTPGASPTTQADSAATPPSPTAPRDSSWGRLFGGHVSHMAAELAHPRIHQDMFGECVSTMAIEAMAMDADGGHGEMMCMQ